MGNDNGSENSDFEGFEKDKTDNHIADIFGESDEEFEGFEENEVNKSVVLPDSDGDEEDDAESISIASEIELSHTRGDAKIDSVESTSKLSSCNASYAANLAGNASGNEEEDEGENDLDGKIESDDDAIIEDGSVMSDFFRIVEMQKIQRRARVSRKKSDIVFINDLDDKILLLINNMKLAAMDDVELSLNNQPATKKLIMLREFDDMMKKADLKPLLIENGMLDIMAKWLSPLPNKVLPNQMVRTTVLKALRDFPPMTTDLLKESGIGKAVMYLYKHPKELQSNKDIARQLINEWSRPIFKLNSDFRHISKEERQQRDMVALPKKRISEAEASHRREAQKEIDQERRAIRPGEDGWVPRARVPIPSNKDYVIRPQWKSGKPKNADEEDDDDDEPSCPTHSESTSAGPKRRRVTTNSNAPTEKEHRLTKNIKSMQNSAQRRRSVRRVYEVSVSGRGL